MTTTLVTGANKGLGKEVARQLVAAGHTAYVGARDQQRGRAAAEELGARFVQLDVTDDASAAAALAQIEADGGLDVLVSNAGIARRAEGGEALDGPSALEVFDTNAVGVIRVTEAALRLLRKSANPVVVNVSSALGSFWATHDPSRPASRYPSIVYGSSKAAVSMITIQYAHAARGQVQCCRAGHHRDRARRWRRRQPPRPSGRRQRADRRQGRDDRRRRPDRHLPGGRRRAGLVTARSRVDRLGSRTDAR